MAAALLPLTGSLFVLKLIMGRVLLAAESTALPRGKLQQKDPWREPGVFSLQSLLTRKWEQDLVTLG